MLLRKTLFRYARKVPFDLNTKYQDQSEEIKEIEPSDFNL
jgi:hypothetical protein